LKLADNMFPMRGNSIQGEDFSEEGVCLVFVHHGKYERKVKKLNKKIKCKDARAVVKSQRNNCVSFAPSRNCAYKCIMSF
jgi:hypothetical protein